MNIHQKRTVSDIVAEDYRTAAVFESKGIDFCCGGNITIEEVTSNNGIDAASLIKSLEEAVRNEDAEASDFNAMPLNDLANYIVEKHHSYVEEKIPVLRIYLGTVCSAHGENHPELHEIAELFEVAAGNLTTHLKKEELILFPYISKMVAARKINVRPETPRFGSVKQPIAAMVNDHENEGERFKVIATLSNNYTIPDDACNTYKVTFAYLKEFEANLHKHIHLENNILFPKAIEMEQELQRK